MSESAPPDAEPSEKVESNMHTAGLLEWTEAEYLTLLRHPLGQKLHQYLDALPATCKDGSPYTLEERVKAKFYYAGVSARYMLESKTSAVKEAIDKHVTSCPNGDRKTGVTSDVAQNHFFRTDHKDTITEYTCAYACEAFTKEYGEDFIEKAYKMFMNVPTALGTAFQKDFEWQLQVLSSGGVVPATLALSVITLRQLHRSRTSPGMCRLVV
jgi:hypothetical protein